ncbi:MAG TPA: FtsQ-type POTRA domain-containing protein [Terriglobia bacterium]|nr:FtsQ-type POTRA domain-containing protein [Terriglobia bacterium]
MSFPEHVPLPEEFDEPSPYRRRQQAVGVRRGRQDGRARVARAVLLGVLLPLGIIGATYVISTHATNSSRFLFHPDQDLALMGNHYVSRMEVMNALGWGRLGIAQAPNVFQLSLAEARKRLEAIPWVESATVSRILPNRLTVNIIERTPVAFVDVGGHLELVDKEGVFLQPPGKAAFDFPVLYGLDPGSTPARRKALLGSYLRFLQETRDDVTRSGWMISEVNLSDPSDLKLLMVQGRETVLAHFGGKDFPSRFKTFARVAPKALADNPRIDSMDMRYNGEVVVDPFRSSPASGNSQKGAAAQ